MIVCIALILVVLLVYSLTVIAFFITGRYRVPLLPLFMMGVALTLVSVARLIRRRETARVLTVASGPAQHGVPG